MTLFWTIWAAVVFGIFFLACCIEVNGARKGFHGANGIFLFASGIIGAFSIPVLFVGTWIGADFWSAAKAALVGAIAYGAVYAVGLRVASNMVRDSGARSVGRRS
ncbi:hypothetical protein [uncultured Massilia sp.]|uniref:hypothetical protein n=1 Tax=uncultured Massilia sp. TaxID=169973 RepID=UPI0025DE0144|nr:hypothetical protein [uncultured Massilia sp.]